MSETTTPAPVVNDMTEDGARPWHGTENPLEALFLWVKAELDALKPKSAAAETQPAETTTDPAAPPQRGADGRYLATPATEVHDGSNG